MKALYCSLEKRCAFYLLCAWWVGDLALEGIWNLEFSKGELLPYLQKT
jgi:hypothetical protein